MPAKEGSLHVVRVLAGGAVVVQSAIAELRAETTGEVEGWRGTLFVPLDEFRMSEAGDLELQMADGLRYRFVIVGSPTSSHVKIRGFGTCPSDASR